MAEPTVHAHDQASRHDPVYDRLVETAEFKELRIRFRNFVWPATGIFLGWYLLYVLMSNWAHDFMSGAVRNINVALVFGLLQFVSTFVIAAALRPLHEQQGGPDRPPARDRVRQGGTSMSSEALTAVLFVVVVLVTVGITFWASRHSSTATDFYAAGRSFSGFQNGMAVSGDYMSAASFLGISGLIALTGYDGFLYSIGFLVAWLVALLLVAELLRNSGRYTMADQLAFRMRQRPVRTAAATSTVVVSIFYLLAQMVGAGALVTLLLGIESEGLKALTIVGVGLLMVFYVTVGGMKGTTWVQIVKAVLLMGGTVLITVLVLAEFGFNLSELLGSAAEKTGKGEAFLQPGLKYGVSTTSKIELRLAQPGAGARHGRAAAHPDPLLHGAHGQGGPYVGAVGDRAHRQLLPDDPRAGLRCGRHAGHRPGERGRRLRWQPGITLAGRGGRRWRRDHGWRHPAGADLGGGVRDHPGGRRGPHVDLGVVGGARPVRHRLQAGRRH